MARSTSGNGVRRADEGGRPPCEDAGDDRPGAGPPTWVVPSGNRVSKGFLAASDPSFAARYPILHDWMTLTGVSGADRDVGTLLLFAQDGKFKACLNDKERSLVAFVSAEGVEALLEACNTGLKNGQLDWREQKYKRK